MSILMLINLSLTFWEAIRSLALLVQKGWNRVKPDPAPEVVELELMPEPEIIE